jgi:hypothetical protein
MGILRGVARPSQAVQVPDGQLQDVRLLQLADVLTLSLEHTPAAFSVRVWSRHGCAMTPSRETSCVMMGLNVSAVSGDWVPNSV